jgi:ribosomal protein L4
LNNNTKKSFRNIENITVDEVRNLNPMDLLNHKFLIIENPEKTLAVLIAKTEK